MQIDDTVLVQNATVDVHGEHALCPWAQLVCLVDEQVQVRVPVEALQPHDRVKGVVVVANHDVTPKGGVER